MTDKNRLKYMFVFIVGDKFLKLETAKAWAPLSVNPPLNNRYRLTPFLKASTPCFAAIEEKLKMKRHFLLLLAATLVIVPMVAQAADGVAMQDGKMMVFKDGQTTLMDKEMMMPDGTKVMPDGTVTRSNVKKVRMVNGMMVDMNGNIIVKNGVMMKDGKMLMVKDGDMMPMNSEIIMSNGTKVTEDGSIIRKMNEGEMIMMDGTATTVKGGAKSKQGGFK
jgi:hypothetical protein